VLKFINVITNGDNRRLVPTLLLYIWQNMLTGMPYVILYYVLVELFKPPAEMDRGLLIGLIAGALAIFVLNIFVAIAARTRLMTIGMTGSADTRLRLGDHLRKLSMGFFKRHDPGDLTSVLLQDIASTETIVAHVYPDVISAIVLPAMIALFFACIDLRITMSMVATVLVAVPALMLVQKMTSRLAKTRLASRQETISRMLEYIQGIKGIKAFNMTGVKFIRLETALKRFRDESVRLEAVLGPFVAVYALILQVGFVTLLLMTMYFLFEGSLTIPLALLFLVIGYRFFTPLNNLAFFLAEYRYMETAARRVLGVLETAPLPEPAQDSAPGNFDIEFKNVTFRYLDDNVLGNASFRVPQNSMTALVGPSGSGKTTITSLIARFWDVNDGEVLVGGVNVKDLPAERLLSYISQVFQDVYLFNDTIYNNIKIGKADATREEVIAAAKAAQCHEFVVKFPDGYDTLVGEGGSTLSGGEKQRVSIARAILKDAPIILLDEATAALDPENELFIQQAINELVESRTLIVIAHRLATITGADQILVLDEGRIVEHGRHEELLAASGLYSHLWAEQTRARGWKFGGGRRSYLQ
jgi:ATP-binding cassette subfamily B protein